MKRIFIANIITSLFFLASCAVQKVKPVAYQNIADLVNNSAVLNQHHVGFLLKEIGTEKVLFQKNSAKYFIPASNTKLLTFYTALNMLGDSVPSIEYAIRKDSLFIWPMADASFLHPAFKNHQAFDFIKNSGKNVYLINGRYKGEKFGKGWGWDDYNDYYQTELSAFPMYGNVININNNGSGKLAYYPDLASMYLGDISVSQNLKTVKRDLDNNNLTVPAKFSPDFKQTIPLRVDKSTITNLLSDTLLATGLVLKQVETLPWRKVPINAKTIYGVKADSLYKQMLQQSDNFIAEEILLNCAAANHLVMRTDSVISVANKNLFAQLPDKIQWLDGSGLSRQNLITPRDLTTVLQKIYDKVGNENRLFSLFPAGGNSGTLKNMFVSTDKPFVFAKTGTMSNNYNLSGYLIGASGKKYLFSFMNNHYVSTPQAVKAEVERILTFIHDNY
ncbi:D-alanyl-D-alanine carboxypeptidase/D-alanyl-D-alanine-endopeptidase [Pedobacter arcticus]|uniref:D-alanyl-D-alanine carboxypeptidase/D-alanyl-D-alanine-endopeptidase n=1 Tax=Pedobacter arcticus TaxID=752140 RepID=UPI0002F08FE4|nr:D-alanyl-D-alanine carboxypeptidase [Pedobacter arcticus]